MQIAMRNILITVALLLMSALAVTAQNNSDMMTVCPNGHRCLSGGVCTRTGRTNRTTGLDEYACDVEGISGQSEVTRAGEVYCVKGVGNNSTTTFCVNKGICTTIIKSVPGGDKEHAGCLCAQNFEGEHCQYPKAQAPDPETSTDSPTPAPDPGADADDSDSDDEFKGDGSTDIRSEGDDSGGLGTGAIIGISLGAFFLVIFLAFVVKRVVSKDNDPSSVIGEDWHVDQNI